MSDFRHSKDFSEIINVAEIYGQHIDQWAVHRGLIEPMLAKKGVHQNILSD